MAEITLNCGTCGGSGLVGGHVGQTPENYGEITDPCPDCAVTVDRKPSSTMTLEQVRDAIRDAPFTPPHTHENAVWADAIDAAIKQRERDKGDAARYRWLKENDNCDLLAEDVIDEAIVAMAKESGNG